VGSFLFGSLVSLSSSLERMEVRRFRRRREVEAEFTVDGADRVGVVE